MCFEAYFFGLMMKDRIDILAFNLFLGSTI